MATEPIVLQVNAARNQTVLTKSTKPRGLTDFMTYMNNVIKTECNTIRYSR